MATTTRKAPGAEAAETGTPGTAQAAAERTAAAPSVGELLDQAQRGLLTLINNSVSPETDHGVDVVLARQAAEVYHILFGESR